jgi:hypothetical protein
VKNFKRKRLMQLLMAGLFMLLIWVAAAAAAAAGVVAYLALAPAAATLRLPGVAHDMRAGIAKATSGTW